MKPLIGIGLEPGSRRAMKRDVNRRSGPGSRLANGLTSPVANEDKERLGGTHNHCF
jgi:hypothetical protein